LSSEGQIAGRRPERQDAVCPACGEGNELAARCAACGAALPEFSSGTPTEPIGMPSPEVTDPLLGSWVSHFRIVSRLGQGGMGVVYRAVDEELGRDVALKFLPPGRAGNPRDEARLHREALAAAALDHPNLGTLYEIGRHQGRRFLVLAFYEGETLAARLARVTRLGAAEAAAVCGQLASALAAAHAAGLVHRDLKPDNVMLLPDGRVKLLDFGLTRDAGDGLSGLPQLTEEGSAVGTAAYMAPEQLRGEPAGPAADLWALGVVLYESLSGRRPFGGDRRGLIHAVLHEDPPPLLDTRRKAFPALAAIALGCLAKEPAERPGAGALVEELRAAGLWVANVDSRALSGAPADRSARRRPAAAWVLVTALLLALAAGIALLREQSGPPAVPLHVAVLRPQVEGLTDAAERRLVEEGLRSAAIRALAGLEGVAADEPPRNPDFIGTPAQLARATGAGEALAADAYCFGDLCRVTLRRLRAADGAVVQEEKIEVLRSSARLSADTTSAAVRRAYAERELRTDDLELQVGEADYDRYLTLLRQTFHKEVPDEDILAGLADLRGRAPAFVDAHLLAAFVARRHYGWTNDEQVFEQGLAAAHRARALAPYDPRPAAYLFDLALDAGRLDTARKALAELERREPIASDLMFRRARLADRAGDTVAAVELMKALVEERPALQFIRLLIDMEYRLGRVEEARAHIREVHARLPDQPLAPGVLALAALNADDPQVAIALLQPLARRLPSRITLNNLAFALSLTDRFAEAEPVLQRLHGLFPDDRQIALDLADCLQRLGRHAEARRHYREVLAMADDEGALTGWQGLSIKAQALAHLGEHRSALEAIEQALRLAADHPRLRLDAATIYALLGKTSAARVHARAALAGDMSPLYFLLPWLAPLRDDPEIARYFAGATEGKSDPFRPGSWGRSP
jgi:tetratricopeptide (TPR) repeat protein